MATLNEKAALGRAVFGHDAQPGETRVYAPAVAASSDGYVSVDIGGQVASIPTVGAVESGQEVVIQVQGGHPVAIGARGWGDSIQDAVDGVVNHFWADEYGVHVSREEADAEGSRNILMDSESMLIRKEADNLVSITDESLAFWDGRGNAPENVVASFGRDGSVIGRANEINTVAESGGFSVRSGLEDLFSVSVDDAYLDSPYTFRKVFKVYCAGHLTGTAPLDTALDGYAHFIADIADPEAALYFGDTWESDGEVSGLTGMLMSVQEYIDNSALYCSYGDISEQMATYYEAQAFALTGTRDYQVKYVGNAYVPFECGFSPETLAQIPRDVWTDQAIAAGAPNWFFGSVYLVPEAKLMLNGEEFTGLPDRYADSPEAAGNATRTNAMLFGRCDPTSTSTAFTATVPGLTSLYDGAAVMLENGVVTSAAGFTIDVNGLGAKPVYSSMAAATRDTTIFNAAYTMLFVYDSERVAGGCWLCYRGYDSNTNTIGYQLRTNSGTLPATDKGYRYRLWFTAADGSGWVPANTSTSTNNTEARSANARPIDPFGPIVYNSYNGTTNAGANLSATALWQQYTLALGYSFNETGSALNLAYPAPVYLKCTPQADGSAVMQGIVQAVPRVDDGKIYILIGIAYSATSIELRMEHPVYFYSDGAVRRWTHVPEALTNLDIDTICR